MPLVGSRKLLGEARRRGYALGGFNIFNLELAQAVVAAAEEERAPVLLQVNPVAAAYAGLAPLAAMGRALAEQAQVPIALHLDHSRDADQCRRALELGFTSLMFDGSTETFERNVALTRAVCHLAQPTNIAVEGELGRIGGRSEDREVCNPSPDLTDPEAAARFVALTGVSSLAVAIGSAHGRRRPQSGLDLERLKEISHRVEVPLVLHGASGVIDGELRQAIELGVAKVNIATQLNQAFRDRLEEALQAKEGGGELRQVLAEAREAVKELVRQKLRLLGASGQAD